MVVVGGGGGDDRNGSIEFNFKLLAITKARFYKAPDHLEFNEARTELARGTVK